MGEFFGNYDLWYYLSWYLWSLIGLVVVSFIAFTNRGNESRFSIWYYLKDNVVDLILWFILTFIIARFINDLKITIIATSLSDMFIAFIWGFFHTAIIRYIRNTDFGKFLKLPYKANGEIRKFDDYE